MDPDILNLAALMLAVLGVPMVFGGVVIPIGKAIARRIEGHPAADEETLAELDALRAEVSELQAHVGRMADLEERLEFAERLLTQQQPPALHDPGSGP